MVHTCNAGFAMSALLKPEAGMILGVKISCSGRGFSHLTVEMYDKQTIAKDTDPLPVVAVPSLSSESSTMRYRPIAGFEELKIIASSSFVEKLSATLSREPLFEHLRAADLLPPLSSHDYIRKVCMSAS